MTEAVEKAPLSPHEIAMVRGCSGAAPTSFILDRLSKWKLKDNGLIVVVMDTTAMDFCDWKKTSIVFLIPQEGDELIKFLSEKSLSRNIMFLSDENYEYRMFLEDSKDGTTNIDADVLDAFMEAFKREWVD